MERKRDIIPILISAVLIVLGILALHVALTPIFSPVEPTAIPSNTPPPPTITASVTPSPPPTATITPSPTATPLPIPIRVSSPVVLLDNSSFHSLALLENGDVLGWGAADILGLSDDSEAVQAVPTLLPDFHHIKAIYARDFHSFFIDEAGDIYEQSFFSQGEYGRFPGVDDIGGTGQVVQIAVGSEGTVIVRKEDGSLWSYGVGNKGQLGIGVQKNVYQFTRIPIDHVIDVMFTSNLALAVRSDGTLWAWGLDKETTGTEEIWPTPRQIKGVYNVQSVAWGDGVSILHADGTVTLWAIPGELQLDGQSPTDPATREFYPIEQLPPIVQIDGRHQFYNIGLAEDGSLWAWGNSWFNVDYNDEEDRIYSLDFGPDRFQGHRIDLDDIVQVSSGSFATLALDKHGTVWVWGWSWRGQGGTGVAECSIPEPVPIIVVE